MASIRFIIRRPGSRSNRSERRHELQRSLASARWNVGRVLTLKAAWMARAAHANAWRTTENAFSSPSLPCRKSPQFMKAPERDEARRSSPTRWSTNGRHDSSREEAHAGHNRGARHALLRARLQMRASVSQRSIESRIGAARQCATHARLVADNAAAPGGRQMSTNTRPFSMTAS
jgi:hypothetical protein